jgi:hypothetical protein
MESAGSFAAAGATLGPVDPVWVFLGSGRSAAKTLVLRVGKAWISLDSLVRIEPFQWVMLDFR